MQRRLAQGGLVFAVLVVLAVSLLAGRRTGAQAQTLPLHGTFGGPIPSFFIVPTSPPTASVQQHLSGGASVFNGPVDLIDTHTVAFAVTQQPQRYSDGVSVMQSGPDALFLFWNAADDGTSSMMGSSATGAVTIRGGRGRFAGASGNATIHTSADFTQFSVAVTIDGVIVVP